MTIGRGAVRKGGEATKTGEGAATNGRQATSEEEKQQQHKKGTMKLL